MAKITKKIPKDIREYKEKIALGLSARQLIAVIVAVVICIPLYLFGADYLGEDITSWLIIALAIGIGLIGFAEKNGMPYDKYLMAVIRNDFIYPSKTMYKSSNFFAENEALAKDEEIQGIKKKKLQKYNEEVSLERAFLLEEAYNNNIDIKFSELNLTTVTKPQGKNDNSNIEKGKTMKDIQKKKSKAQLVAEQVEQKKKENPKYIPTKQEGKMLLKYANEVNINRTKQIEQGKKEIQKKNAEMNKRKKAKTFIPKSSQDDLPYLADFDEGLFEVETNIYSKCYEILDINYLTAKDDEADFIYKKWGEFLNYFTEDISLSISIDNKIISFEEQLKKVCFPYQYDKLDIHRKEWNKILKKQMMNGNNDMLQSKYITVSLEAFSPYEALLKFRKIDKEVLSNLEKIGSSGRVLSTEERLSMLHDKMRKGREGQFDIDFEWIKNQGISSKDYVAPSSFWFRNKSYFMIENTYCRCMYVNNLSVKVNDEFISDITQCDFPLLTTLSIQPIDEEKTHKMIKRRLTGMEANKIEAERKAMKSGYDPSSINHDLKRSYKEGLELLERIENNDEKMFFVSIMMMISADSLEELEENTKALESKITTKRCQIQCFDNQQREAYKVIMPMGIRPKGKLFVDRALPTESTAIFIPFTAQDLFEESGVYIGINQLTRNMIICDRTKLKTPSGFVLGSSGSGKSFKCKETMLSILLSDNDINLFIIDPENEYKILALAFGGSILTLSPNTETYISPMEMDENYGLDEDDDSNLVSLEIKKDKALRKKSDYLMSIIQCMITDGEGVTMITPAQKSLIDRAIKRTYEDYLMCDFDKKYLPTLIDLQEELDKEKGTEDGRLVAEAVEYYTKGSMNLFSHHTNVDMDNRFIVFAIRDLTEELKQISLLIVLDFIWNKMTENSLLKKRTYCFVDEVHILFANLFSARYLQQYYKRGRKYGLVVTGITQDLEEVLKSEMARSMIQNSEFIIMLSQTGENLDSLTKLRKISDVQKGFVEMADTGCGLLFAGKSVIPFEDDFPKESYLYTLLSTNFNEDNEDMINEILSKVADLETQEYAK